VVRNEGTGIGSTGFRLENGRLNFNKAQLFWVPANPDVISSAAAEGFRTEVNTKST